MSASGSSRVYTPVNFGEFKRLVVTHLKREPRLNRIYVEEQIQPELLKKARENFAKEMEDEETPLLLLDASTFGNVSCGVLATDQALYWKNFNKAQETCRLSYGRFKSISVGGLTFMDGRSCVIEYHRFAIPVEFSAAGDAIIAFLQIASGQEPHQSEEEIEQKLSAPPDKAKQAQAIIAMLLIVLVVGGVIWAFISNPRLLAPIALGIVAAAHSAGKNAFVKLTDFIVWVALTVAMWDWMMPGFK
jgi:hypothetical protein